MQQGFISSGGTQGCIVPAQFLFKKIKSKLENFCFLLLKIEYRS
jgi:hypothetical protein